jgi:hypothetical protein
VEAEVEALLTTVNEDPLLISESVTSLNKHNPLGYEIPVGLMTFQINVSRILQEDLLHI